MGIMVIVFSNMFRFNIQNYPVYLIIGQSIFNFTNEATSKAMWSIIGNASLLKKTYVPKYIFCLSTVSSSFVNMLFSLAAMFIVFVVCGVQFTWNMLFIPFILLQVFIFALGMGLFLAEATVFFRDIQYIYSAFLTAWMYATPIFYPLEQIHNDIIQWIIVNLNPMYTYIQQFRTIALNGTFPEASLVIRGILVSLLMLAFGMWRFMRNQDRFILYI
jgi:lipopolysaccharide transport system permease protein